MKYSHSCKGFTLLELMVALTITLVIGLAAHSLFGTAIKSRDISRERSADLERLQKAMWIVTEDIQQSVPQTLQISDNGEQVEFIRKGWMNLPESTSSDLVHVSYEYRDKSLLRHVTTEANAVEIAQTQVLFNGIYDWQAVRPTPLAIEISFVSDRYGSLCRIIEIPGS